MKLVGYKWNTERSAWIRVYLPRCKKGRLKHDIYRYHIGYYGPFGAAVGECQHCDHSFKGTAKQFIRNIRDKGRKNAFRKAFPFGIAGINL